MTQALSRSAGDSHRDHICEALAWKSLRSHPPLTLVVFVCTHLVLLLHCQLPGYLETRVSLLFLSPAPGCPSSRPHGKGKLAEQKLVQINHTIWNDFTQAGRGGANTRNVGALSLNSESVIQNIYYWRDACFINTRNWWALEPGSSEHTEQVWVFVTAALMRHTFPFLPYERPEMQLWGGGKVHSWSPRTRVRFLAPMLTLWIKLGKSQAISS